MYFFIASFIVIICASIITIRILTAYSGFSRAFNLFTAALIAGGWLAPLTIGWIRRENLLDGEVYAALHWGAYALFGFVFLLFCLLILRDVLWFLIYRLWRLFGRDGTVLDPKSAPLLNKMNFWTVLLAVGLSAYALYEGMKTPRLVELTITDPKITTPADIVILSDFHVNRTTPVKKIKKLTARIKGLRPDVVLIAGDLIDDKASTMPEQIKALAGLHGKYGTYMVLGNHEFYAGLTDWLPLFPQMGYRLLYNDGVSLPPLKLYIGGIPDANTTRRANKIMRPDLPLTMQKAHQSEYKILLSHSPSFLKELAPGKIDLMISGHTHGGQIFPFHFLVSRVNDDFLSGLYEEKDKKTKLYVSNGYGFWGPSMRLFAPSELVLLHLEPEASNK